MLRSPSLAPLLVVLGCASAPARRETSNEPPVVQLVEEIRRADYAGDRATLRVLRGGIATASTDGFPASRLLYWQAFALWRRVINGFNETPTPDDLDADLVEASRTFEAALREDPRFVDAQAGLASCLGMRLFLRGKQDPEGRALVPRIKELLTEAETLGPENPRLLWVRGPVEWWSPPGSSPETVDAHQARAIATYTRGLEALRRETPPLAGSLSPAWGEAELHMSLAWSHLNRRVPDLDKAEAHARTALGLAPSWHYVRDILLPQIEAARRTAAR